MINNDFRVYEFEVYNPDEQDEYGQPVYWPSVGDIKMAIYTTSQSIQDNINYQGANYIGFTYEPINDTYVIQYNGTKLKVLYVNPTGRYKQVFLTRM